MHELTHQRGKQRRRTGKKKEDAVEYSLGNETIIQPKHSRVKEMASHLAVANIFIGAAIGAAASAVGTGCLAIGMPVGGGLGLIIGSASKGLNYNAKPGKEIYIKLTQDLEICY